MTWDAIIKFFRHNFIHQIRILCGIWWEWEYGWVTVLFCSLYRFAQRWKWKRDSGSLNWISFRDRFQKAEVKSNDLIFLFKTLTRKCYAVFFINTLIFYRGSSCKSSKLTMRFLLGSHQQCFHVPLVLCCDCADVSDQVYTHTHTHTLHYVLKQIYPVCTSVKSRQYRCK